VANLSAVKGSCLCGAVNISTSVSNSVAACHCNMCRQWGGGPLLAVECGNDVSFNGKENIGIYQSSEWAERGFCNKCGSHLFYKYKQNDRYFMPVGIFDRNENFIFDSQIFIDEKPEYYCFANETKNMTGAEAFEEFTSSLEK
jgi:hypothetical protein